MCALCVSLILDNSCLKQTYNLPQSGPVFFKRVSVSPRHPWGHALVCVTSGCCGRATHGMSPVLLCVSGKHTHVSQWLHLVQDIWSNKQTKKARETLVPQPSFPVYREHGRSIGAKLTGHRRDSLMVLSKQVEKSREEGRQESQEFS